jgi:ketosteroid isomerase-like protein
MRERFEFWLGRRGYGAALVAVLALGLAVAGWAPGALAQKNKTKPPADSDNGPAPQMPTANQIDSNIGQMLGAWQVGDVEAMHKYYADDATFTSGAYEVPIVGWKNYEEAYQRQRARIQAMNLIRRNTSIFFRPDFAWATYQWELTGTVDNGPMAARGQTTLVFALTNGKWLIVHNHTSEICGAVNNQSTGQQPAGPAKAVTPK